MKTQKSDNFCKNWEGILRILGSLILIFSFLISTACSPFEATGGGIDISGADQHFRTQTLVFYVESLQDQLVKQTSENFDGKYGEGGHQLLSQFVANPSMEDFLEGIKKTTVEYTENCLSEVSVNNENVLNLCVDSDEYFYKTKKELASESLGKIAAFRGFSEEHSQWITNFFLRFDPNKTN